MTARLNIALVSEHASPLAVVGGVDAGGQNVHVAALARELALAGHEVTVFTRRDSTSLPDRVPFEGYVVDHVPAGPPTDVPKDELLQHMPEFARYLRSRFMAERFDVVHAHFWMSGFAAIVAARGTGIPVVQTFHALGVVKRAYQGAADTSPPERLRIESAVCRNATHIVATSTDEVSWLSKMGARRERITVVPCGVDIDHFRPTGAETARSNGVYRLLYVGRLVERKGIDDIIRALRWVPDTELLVAGGPERTALEVDPEAGRLSAVAAEAGVASRVSLLGRVSRSDLPALLRSADVVVTVPWYEPFGIVPLEAMACGTPVLASAVGGLLDTVVDGVTGTLVPPRAPEVLGRELRGLLADAVRRGKFGLAGLDRVTARYTWKRVAENTDWVYNAVCATVKSVERTVS